VCSKIKSALVSGSPRYGYARVLLAIAALHLVNSCTSEPPSERATHRGGHGGNSSTVTGGSGCSHRARTYAGPEVVWGDVIAIDAPLDAGNLTVANELIDRFRDTKDRPPRALRVARHLRYTERAADAEAPSSQAANMPTPRTTSSSRPRRSASNGAARRRHSGFFNQAMAAAGLSNTRAVTPLAE
jgi:hypothetical protein